MDIPDLVQRTLGDEEVTAGVSLGDEDAVCLTPTRSLVYKGDGLLSDEQVEEFPHDVERIAVSEGRRKTKFVFEYIGGTRSFTVPSDRDEDVLEAVMEGVLRVASVIDDGEELVSVYRFSELTLIVAESRLVKLIGEQVWNDDHEVYAYDDVTGLEFERASVATSVVVSIEGRPQRVKVPNDRAPVVRQTIEQALCAYYDVATVEELNQLVGRDEPDADDEDGALDFGSGIDPLVTDDDSEVDEYTEGTLREITAGSDDDATTSEDDAGTADAGAGAANAGTDAAETESDEGDEDSGPVAPETAGAGVDDTGSDGREDAPAGASASETAVGVEGVEPASREDLATVADRLEELTEAVDRQNELLKRQHRAIKQLADEIQAE
ncbi:hypothetical protein BRC64_10180 [Halobacteriales archaeon QH_10_67_22]|nr:MAG: hypothetical protein BRC64_10180 [Halobacteriales archaeon QH_10_67_22]